MSKSLDSSPAARTLDGTVRSVVDELASILGRGGPDDSRNTARDIVAALLHVSRYWSVLAGDVVLQPQVADAARVAAQRLVAGAPFAYAVGSAQFRSLTLCVDERVLIPRPETEVLVEEILTRFGAANPGGADWGTAVDIGTGSGAIALSLAAEGCFARVVGTDTSLDALDVARTNAGIMGAALRCPVEFRSGSLLAPVRDIKARLLVSNPPYIAYEEADHLPPSVRSWEPPTALLSGSNGLAITAAIVQKGKSLLDRRGTLALEVDERRASLVAELVLSDGGYTDVSVVLDLTGRERFVFASRA
ncbi:MAG TPA: peptide chain release factor N(5)-glutamine methyltransferase [Gemmatimonadaceae bacterium]|nr:peptide chain release factor N(5)-glutamine methyltransferase [Gemmatimonadaceae bacterium]